MDVQILNLETLFTKNIRYDIPLFQRRYVWDQEEQWEPLWEDVRNTAESCVGDNGFQQAHFLGAVVIQGKLQPVGRLDIRIVVDGQQRLTTMQLLLDAAQEVFEQRGYDDLAEYLSEFVLNKRTFQGGDPDKAFKVWPTMGDQDAFRQTMHNHLPSDEYRESRIVRAHEFFKLQISQWLEDLPDEANARADALERTLAHLLQLVVIDLAPNEEPHVIFETLNARGTPLLQSDLVKNLLLFEAGQAESADTSEIWGFDTEWWNEEVFQGRLLRPRVDAFLNFWLVMRKQEEIAHNDVFAIFRRYFATECKSDVNAVADDLREAGKAYMSIEKCEVPAEVKPFLYRTNVMRAGVLTPVFMWLLSSKVPMEQVTESLQVLESYLVRRMVCGMSTRSYNRLFIGMLSALEGADAESSGEAIARYLRSQESYATQWPDDQQLENAFLNRPVYRLMTRGRTRIVLEGIEDGLRTDKAGDQSVARDLTIEHVMPRGWRSGDWKLPADVEDKETASSNRDHLVHTMGNLTLARGSLNTSLSNRPWEEKRAELHDHITLFLNKDLVKEPEWNEERIEARARQLAQVAMEVWPRR